MKSYPHYTVVFSALLALFTIPSPAFQPPSQAPLLNFDKRTEASQARSAVVSDQQVAAEQLRARLPRAQVDFDPVTGAPKFISAGDTFLSGKNGEGKAIPAAAAAEFNGEPHQATKAFLREHSKLFGYGPEVLDKARVKREFVTAHNGLTTTIWEQQVDGIPLFEGVLISHTTRQGELVNLSSQFVPDPQGAADRGVTNRMALLAAPEISARTAVAIAAQNIGAVIEEKEIVPTGETNWVAMATGPERRQEFQATALKGETGAKLIWLPMSRDQLRLCWDVVLMSRARGEMFRVLVDAQTGEPLVRHCLTDYLSDATYRVYTSDSPSPFSPGYSTPTSSQPPLVSRTLVTFSALDTNASPAGWINDGGNETVGNNVDAHTDRNADDQPDLPRPHGSPFRVFDFPLDLTQAPSTYTNAAVVQLFYWNNFMHDKLYELGFTEAAGNFQNNNFGRGGLGNDAVQADAQDGSGVNNANFSTPPDGSPGRMQMFLFTSPSPARDGDLDAEVVLHEYTHGLSNRRVGGGVGISALQSGGMGEGWSDFYALALLSEPDDDVNGVYANGGYVTYQLSGMTQNYYFGIRRYPYCTDTNKNPLTFKDIDPAQASAHTGIPRSPITCTTANEVHNMGEVWCVTLREARANLINKYGWTVGNQLMLQLVTDGMNLSPANPNFLQARDAILQADQVDNGGANLTELWAGFAKRGMGKSATSPSSSTTTGLQEAYDVPFQPLQLVVPISATEGDGVLAGAGHVSLPFPVGSNVVIALSSSDTSEATVPATVTVLAGQTNAAFGLTIPDDGVLDGTQTSTITASAIGFANGYGMISIFDNETATLQAVLPATAAEGQGTVQGTVQVSAVPAANIVVSLSSSDTTEIQVPTSVTIPAGQTSAVFTASVVDDNQIDGPQAATVTAHVQNWTDGSATITVLDNESLNLAVTLPASAAENAGVLTNAGSVSISGTLPTNLVVSLASGTPAKLTVPSSVTISAGQVSTTFNLTLVDNAIPDGHQNVTVTASAAGFTNGSASIFVMDDESPPPPSNPRPGHLAVNVPANTNLMWNNGTSSELVLNGGFETGTLTNWVLVPGAYGHFTANNGTFDPPSPDGPLPPYAGSFSALAYPTGAGIFYMYQDITIPSGVSFATLSWAHRVRNFYTSFSSSQQFQVRLCNPNNTVLATPFTTNPGDPLLGDWVQKSYDVTSFAGQTVRVMFWVNPGSYYLDVHVDSVSVQTSSLGGVVYTNDVYFGTNPTPGPAELQGSTTNSFWTLPLLSPQTTYYWQIVAHKGGTAAGPVWQFTTKGVDHFVWAPVYSPQVVNQPFSVALAAKDAFNTTVSNFTGPVALSAGNGQPDALHVDFESGLQGFSINNSFGSGNGLWHLSTGRGSNPGHSPSTSLYYGHNEGSTGGGNYDTGTANGGVVTSSSIVLPSGLGPITLAFNYLMNVESITSFDQAFVEVSTNNGVSYVVVAGKGSGLTSSTGGLWVSNSVALSQFAGSTILLRFRFDTIDNIANSTEGWYLDDIVILGSVGGGGSISLTPTNTGAFTAGVWSGSITAQQPATNVVLRADDGSGHTGSSNPFDVTVTNDISINILDSPDPVSVGASLTYTLTVANTGPSAATGVSVTNLLPAGAAFVSATASQGTCTQNGGVVTCALGVVPGGTNATITIVVVPTVAGITLTNSATASRLEVDPYLGNNAARATTVVTTPAISIADASVVEGNVGTTNMIFAATLAAPSAQTITVNYATANGGATAGSDYVATNSILIFPPGTTNGTITVAVIGDTLVESNETFFVNLSNPVNGALGRSAGVGTIVDDDGLPGQVDHFTWSTIASPQFTNTPFGVTIHAWDASSNPASNFTGTVSLYGTATNRIGTNMDFEAGTLAPWTPLNVGNQPGPYDLVTFDVNGDAISSTAFRIAANSGTPDGITQNVSLTGGATYTVKMDIATDDTSSGNNADGGTTAILIGGTTVTQFSWGFVNIGNIYRTNLTGTFTPPSTGVYAVILTFYRGYFEAGNLWCLADDLRIVGPGGPVTVLPTVTGNFTNGIWSGNMTVLNRATYTVLVADDGNGHLGLSNPFDVASANMAPVILLQPTNQTVIVGDSATFSVAADGTPPLSYQWRFSGTNLSGATNTVLTLTNVQPNQAGNYAVLVTNNYGSILSSNGVLTVNPLGSCDPAPSGLVSWWPGEGNGNDIVGTNNGVLEGGIGFGAGETGQAFLFNNTNADVRVPGSSSLNVGTGSGFTVEAWINPSDVTQPHPLFEWNNSAGSWGVHFYITTDAGPGSFYVNVIDSGGNWHEFSSPTAPLRTNVFQHVALTYDKASGMATVYYNGTMNVQRSLGSFTPKTTYDLCLGRRPASGASQVFSFAGLFDEPSLYNRALSSNEIAAIYNADSGGKCPPTQVPPVITGFSPISGFVGGNVTISGTNFSPVVTNNVVYFGAVRATVSAASATHLVVTVPVGATYAPITETVNGLTAYANRSFMPTFLGIGQIDTTSLASRVNLGAGNGPAVTALGDLDGDGKPDLVVNNVYDGSVWIYRNISTNGSLTTGSFAPPVILPIGGGIDSVWGLALADLNGDGRLDIVVANRNFNNVSIFQNRSVPGSLTINSFAPRVDFVTGAQPRGVEVRDIDGDGKLDLLTANAGDGTVSILRNTGMMGSLTTNSFAPKVDIATGSGCDSVAVEDLDGDGKPDVVVVDYNDSSGTMSVLQNNCTPGNLSFAAKVDFPCLPDCIDVRACDLDGDGKTDLIVTGGAYGQAISVYRNTSAVGSLTTNSFAPRVDFGVDAWAQTMAIGDLDGDGKPDVAVVTELPSQLSIFKNASSPDSFTANSFAPRVDFLTGYNAWGVSVGDLDGDGRPDIVFANAYDNTISIYRNIVPFSAAPRITSQPKNQYVPPGCDATFNVLARGTPPLKCRWWKDGLALNGQTNLSLMLTNVQTSDFGSYSVVVANGFGSVTSSPAQLALGHSPVANADAVYRFASGGVRVNVNDLLANDTDPDGDYLTIIGVSPNSTAGGAVGLTNNWVYYAPPGGSPNGDTFTYMVSDGHCGTGVGTVTVQIKADNPQPLTFGIANPGDGSIRLAFDGIPGYTYRIEYTDSLSNPNWQTLTTRTADGFGVCQFVDGLLTNVPVRYYRAVWP